MRHPSRREFFTVVSAGLAGVGAGVAMTGDGGLFRTVRRAYHDVQARFINEERYFDIAARRPAPRPGLNRLGLFDFTVPPIESVRVGVIGIGVRGLVLARVIANTPNCRLVAACDLRETQLTKLEKALQQDGNGTPLEKFSGEADAYLRLLDLELDLILIATPWEDHVPMALAAMERDKNVAVEVPACIEVEEAWALLEAMERSRRHCMMLENTNYGEAELTVLNLTRSGVLGEVVHTQAAYNHDLRVNLASDTRNYPPHWRFDHHKRRNGNLYPTHGIGPVSKYLGLLAGDTMESLVSVSSKSAGLHEFLGSDEISIAQGDMNTSVIKTAKGRTIQLQFNTSSPRPHSLDNAVIGTRGSFFGYPDRLAVGPKQHRFNGLAWQRAKERYGSRLWTQSNMGAFERKFHGGRDTLMISNLISNLVAGRPMDIDIYETLLWSVLAPITERSVANNSAMTSIPDFTKGLWKDRKEPSMPENWLPVKEQLV